MREKKNLDSSLKVCANCEFSRRFYFRHDSTFYGSFFCFCSRKCAVKKIDSCCSDFEFALPF